MSCGKTLGHGINCTGDKDDSYLCRECKLRFENEELKAQIKTLSGSKREPTGRKMELEFDELPMLQVGVQQWRVRANNRKLWHKRVLDAVREVSLHHPAYTFSKWIKAGIVCTRYSTREPDQDNLVISFKAIIDGLVQCGVLVEDNNSVILQREYKWEKCKRIDQRVTIVVTELA